MQGKLHTSEAFSYSKEGHTMHEPLSDIDGDLLRTCVENYRRFRTSRAALVKAWRDLLGRVDRMEELRRIDLRQLRKESDGQSATHS